EIAPTTLEGVNQRVTNLSTTVEQETTIMYDMMEDAQDDRSLLRARVKLLYRDRPVHHHLAVMTEREREARMAREAWGLSMDASDYARSDVMSLRTMVVVQSALISELQSADHRRQRVISELLASDHKRQVQLTKTLRLLKGLQTQMVEFQRQHGPAKGPAQPDAPGEAAFDDAFDDLDALDYMETKDAHNEKGVNTEDQVSTVNPDKGTDKPKVSTDQLNVSTDKLDKGTAEPKNGNSDENATPTATLKVFGDDETITEPQKP
ncbi:hypothetical protein Tco_0352932, partial [Tanacetum coccineum]